MFSFPNLKQSRDIDVLVSLSDERFVFPTVEHFNVQLFSPVTWEAIPNTKYVSTGFCKHETFALELDSH